MKNKKLTRMQKSTSILESAKTSKWCYVNTDNEFNFMDNKFSIDEKVEDYKVYNKAGLVENYTNESYMEQILAVLNKEGHLQFYNQNFSLIQDVYPIVRSEQE